MKKRKGSKAPPLFFRESFGMRYQLLIQVLTLADTVGVTVAKA
ncbi:hypothetical protein SAMN02800691_0792 [Luteibacter sp. UNCMF366Tsu5.1]|nr:hypothetical protein SAMN02800691_0792 [Luteibacter sp. UNCMF366Tsu5.1]